MGAIDRTIDQLLLDSENPRNESATTQRDALQKVLDDQEEKLFVRGGSGWLDSVDHSLSGAWQIADYAAVRRVVRLS